MNKKIGTALLVVGIIFGIIELIMGIRTAYVNWQLISMLLDNRVSPTINLAIYIFKNFHIVQFINSIVIIIISIVLLNKKDKVHQFTK